MLPDGSWRVGEEPVRHEASLRYFKAHLSLEGSPAIVDRGRSVPIVLEGPAFEVTRLVLDAARGECRVVLDDGSEETLVEDALGMSTATGRFECVVRGGRATAVLTRGAHQSLLDAVEEEGGSFFLKAGPHRIRVRT